MKIIMDELPRSSIEAFADKHKLEMFVGERTPFYWPDGHYYARFNNTDTKGDGVLIGEYGNGPTKEIAIAEYARIISCKTIVVDAFSGGKKKRREIRVPLLHTEEKT